MKSLKKIIENLVKYKYIFIVFISFIFIGLFGIFYALNSVRDAKKLATKKIESIAIQLGDAISSQFYERYWDVQAFAVNEKLIHIQNKALSAETLNKYVSL